MAIVNAGGCVYSLLHLVLGLFHIYIGALLVIYVGLQGLGLSLLQTKEIKG